MLLAVSNSQINFTGKNAEEVKKCSFIKRKEKIYLKIVTLYLYRHKSCILGYYLEPKVSAVQKIVDIFDNNNIFEIMQKIIMRRCLIHCKY